METPRGFNPVGESAPGLPRHDAALPGHVPGQYDPMGGNDDNTYSTSGGMPINSSSAGAYPPWLGIWFGRVVMAVAIYLSLPIQIALYPIAGIPAVLAGGVTYLFLSISGMPRDSVLDWVWMVSFASLLPAMRIETGVEERNASYRNFRHWLRLGLLAASMFFFAIRDRGESAGKAAFIALVVAVMAHFILRAALLKGLWNSLQTWLWLRKA